MNYNLEPASLLSAQNILIPVEAAKNKLPYIF